MAAVGAISAQDRCLPDDSVVHNLSNGRVRTTTALVALEASLTTEEENINMCFGCDEPVSRDRHAVSMTIRQMTDI